MANIIKCNFTMASSDDYNNLYTKLYTEYRYMTETVVC